MRTFCIAFVICLMASVAFGQRRFTVQVINPGDFQVVVQGLNNSGVVVGGLKPSISEPRRGLRWQNGDLQLLAKYGTGFNMAFAINDNGTIVGEIEDTAGALLWTDPQTVVSLGNLGDHVSRATGINNLGRVVGYSRKSAAGPLFPFLWGDGAMTELPTPQSSGGGAY